MTTYFIIFIYFAFFQVKYLDQKCGLALPAFEDLSSTEDDEDCDMEQGGPSHAGRQTSEGTAAEGGQGSNL